ncbi:MULTISPECIES: TPM domain-containing protein [Sphingomonas]|uniref:TPM domain-containing protein n=1 Tax=Sphingomonas TaxID=13687 RepID=UPI000DEEF0B9|nr:MULTISPECIES: TPM domain-containing protein [Sphingomonas]
MSLAISEADRERVGAAVTAAEAASAGEIVTIVTEQSDAYHDVALQWAVVVLALVLAWAAAFPNALLWWREALLGSDWSGAPSLRETLFFLMALALLKFTAALLILRWRPLRLALTPGATKHRRVRRRAVALFKAAAERRTTGRTGILIYLSVAERRAEIVADEAIMAVTTPETWGEAMTELTSEIRAGRPADGLIKAVERVGAVLAGHFPRAVDDRNEIPDKLIEL